MSENTSNGELIYIIETESAISGYCLIGEGATEKDAWYDAYGPKPWSAYIKSCAKDAILRQVTQDEVEAIRAEIYNK